MTQVIEPPTIPTTWRIHIGCHQGTLTSRDSHTVTEKYGGGNLESLQDCIDCAKAWESNYASMGCFIWFAHAIAPDGTNHQDIVPGHFYRD